jgi:hypothetical protein
MIDKSKEIMDGLKHYVFPSEETEQLAKERADICGKCEYNKNNKCSLCGCFLVLKVRSKKTNCPANKWIK